MFAMKDYSRWRIYFVIVERKFCAEMFPGGLSTLFTSTRPRADYPVTEFILGTIKGHLYEVNDTL